MELGLYNFQAHKESIIKLHLNVTSITGSSDRGKSSIIRAFELLALNKPDGDAYRRRKSKETNVTLDIDNDNIIKTRSKTKNQYEVNGNILKALRREIPEQVSDIINIGPENIQKQKEQYFLLDLPPGQVAKKFNEVVDLEKTDEALREVNSRITSLDNERKTLIGLIGDLNVTITENSWIDSADKNLKKIEEAEILNQRRLDSIQTITSIILTIENLEMELEDLLPPLIINDINTLLNKIENKEQILKKIKSLNSLILTITLLQEEKANIIIPDVTPLLTLVCSAENILKTSNSLQHIIDTITDLETEKITLQKNIESVNIKYVDLMRKAGVCPTCGLDTSKLKRI